MSKDITKEDILNRLEELREYIREESISYAEIAELQSLKDYIDKGDVELLQWVGKEEEKTERERLLEVSNNLFEELSNILDDDEVEKLNRLLEIERELTLQEGK